MKSKCFIHLLVCLIAALIPCSLFSQGVTIAAGTQAVASGDIQLVIDNGGLKNDGIFKPANSTVIFSGAGATAISGSQQTNFYNVIFKGTGTKLNAGTAAVIGTVGVEGTTIFDADGSSNDKSFTILSSDTATGRVDILTTGDIAGNVTVERFINTGTSGGQHAKSWQFLATPTTGQTYFQSWQESGLTPAGYGTWLTGTGTGFDVTTLAPSVKYYDQATGNWIGVTNTGNQLQNKLGYMLFVRGDRTVTTYNGTPNNTNMRSKGVLFTPSNPAPTVPVTANQFQSFGNPYASRIEFNKVYLASTGINDVFYVWDPKLNGNYGLGGYQTISGLAGYIPTAGSSTAYYPSGVPSPYIESGQAVFVQGNGSGGNVSFNENCKTGGSCLVNKGPDDGTDFLPAGRLFLFTTLFTQSGMIADGNIVAFQNGLGNHINQFDANKIINAGENFGIRRNEKILAVEAREEIMENDTIFYQMQNLKQLPYQLRFAPVDIPSNITAFLIDKYNNSSTPISVTDSSFIDFSINGDAASNAPDRFMLVFKQSTVVPVKIISIAATRNQDQAIDVTWKVDNELNLQQYQVERSGNGTDFNAIGNTAPTVNNGGRATYLHRDGMPLASVNFYRIKAISNNGQVQYSSIVKVDPKNTASGITVYPNPVTDKKINITFRNQPAGNYTVQLTNKAGQLIYQTGFYVDQPNYVGTINTGNIISAGTYQVAIINEDGTRMTEQIIVK